jgi:hypothetical protein
MIDHENKTTVLTSANPEASMHPMKSTRQSMISRLSGWGHDICECNTDPAAWPIFNNACTSWCAERAKKRAAGMSKAES